jgi:hypothetical protein
LRRPTEGRLAEAGENEAARAKDAGRITVASARAHDEYEREAPGHVRFRSVIRKINNILRLALFTWLLDGHRLP